MKLNNSFFPSLIIMLLAASSLSYVMANTDHHEDDSNLLVDSRDTNVEIEDNYDLYDDPVSMTDTFDDILQEQDLNTTTMQGINPAEMDDYVSPEEAYQLQQVTTAMQQMLDLINSERRRNGVSPELCFNSKLNAAALAHSNDMIRFNYFSHTGRDGSSFSQRMRRAGYNTNGRRSENIAINSNVARAHASLMNSAGHRRNILTPGMKHIGLGINRITSGRYAGSLMFTQVFGSSSTERCSSSGGSSSCRDSPQGWHDSDGPRYNCAWYAQGSNCAKYGNGYANRGRTANQACCVCGGGN